VAEVGQRPLAGLLLGDLLRTPAVEQLGAREALGQFAQVLHGVQQLVHVGGQVAHRGHHRQHVLVQVLHQHRQPVDQGDQGSDLRRVQVVGEGPQQRCQLLQGGLVGVHED